MTDLPYLASRLYGTPLLIARPKLEIILGVMGRKLAGDTLPTPPPEAMARSDGVQITESGIAVIPILGTLVRRSSYLVAASGLTSYVEIEAMADEAFADPRVKAVLLEIDSSGGEAGGVFDLAARLRSLAKTSGKLLWAIADEAALSAAYALACAADRLWLTRTAEVGSIGVVAVHVDESEADRQAGLSYTFIHAGSHKVDGHPHAPLPLTVAADIQTDIDALHAQFIALVAGLRGLGVETVRATQARVYRADQAIAAGLADQIGSFREAALALSQAIAPKIRNTHNTHNTHNTPLGRQTTPTTLTTFSASRSPQEIFMNDSPQPAPAIETTDMHNDVNEAAGPNVPTAALGSAANAAPAPAPSVDEAAITARVESRLRAQLTELTQVAAQAKRLGLSVDPAQALERGITPDALRKSVLEQAAELDAAQDIVAQTQTELGVSKPQALADSPLVKAAKKVSSEANPATHPQGTRK